MSFRQVRIAYQLWESSADRRSRKVHAPAHAQPLDTRSSAAVEAQERDDRQVTRSMPAALAAGGSSPVQQINPPQADAAERDHQEDGLEAGLHQQKCFWPFRDRSESEPLAAEEAADVPSVTAASSPDPDKAAVGSSSNSASSSDSNGSKWAELALADAMSAQALWKEETGSPCNALPAASSSQEDARQVATLPLPAQVHSQEAGPLEAAGNARPTPGPLKAAGVAKPIPGLLKAAGIAIPAPVLTLKPTPTPPFTALSQRPQMPASTSATAASEGKLTVPDVTLMPCRFPKDA